MMRGKTFSWVLVGLISIGSVEPTQAQGLRDLFLPKPKAELPADRRFTVMVPMRDGKKLATLVTLPEGDGPFPVILTRTPYGKETPGLGAGSVDFVSDGYAHVVQDTRGTGDSEGNFGEFFQEKGDGFDTLTWIDAQPWCNDRVGLFGVSAGGILANFAAMTDPPNLKCCFVVVAHGCDFRFGSFSGGVFLKDLNERWFKALGHPLEASAWPRIGVYDDVAAGMDMKNNYGNVHVPIYNVCGWYDCFGESGIENFEGLQSQGGEGARGRQRLHVGAFGHFPLNGNLVYPKDAARPDPESMRRWFAHWLKGEDNGIMEEPSVRYFLMGDTFDPKAPGNEWRTTNDWPPKSEKVTMWLAPNGALARRPSDTESSLTYRSDPRNPVPTQGGNNLFLPRGPKDQSPTRNRSDVLRFESEPLADSTEVVGRIHARLKVSTDAEDTDFVVKLVDIYPDGYEALVLDQPLRLRYRNGLANQEKAVPGQTYDITVNLGTIALVFHRGHKIAVHVQSTNSPRFEPHTNTWEPVPSYEQSRVAENTVHLGGEPGSRIELPVTKVYSSDLARGE